MGCSLSRKRDTSSPSIETVSISWLWCYVCSVSQMCSSQEALWFLLHTFPRLGEAHGCLGWQEAECLKLIPHWWPHPLPRCLIGPGDCTMSSEPFPHRAPFVHLPRFGSDSHLNRKMGKFCHFNPTVVFPWLYDLGLFKYIQSNIYCIKMFFETFLKSIRWYTRRANDITLIFSILLTWNRAHLISQGGYWPPADLGVHLYGLCFYLFFKILFN